MPRGANVQHWAFNQIPELQPPALNQSLAQIWTMKIRLSKIYLVKRQ